MISIKITKKYNALVDLEYAYLKKYRWRVCKIGNTYYALRKAYGKHFSWNMSWDVLGRPEDGLVVDHRNGEGLDNRKSNLRFVTQRQNSQNRHQEMTSKYPGVKRSGKKWVAAITVDKKYIYLGTYADQESAFDAYKRANEAFGFPEVITSFDEEPITDPNLITRSEYFRMFQLMKQDGLSDEEIEGNLKGVRIAEDEKTTIN